MKTRNLLTTFVLFLLPLGALAEGGGHVGGGEAVIFPNGSVRLVDLLDPSDLPSAPVSEDFIREHFFPDSTRYVTTLGENDRHFFDCAISKFTASGIKTLVNFAPALKQAPVMQIETRLKKWTGRGEAPRSIAPNLASTSDRIPVAFQEPLAAFNNGMIWVSKRFASRLNTRDACGLSVHEAFRVFNYMAKPVQVLSTAQIEDLTRKIMSASTDLANVSLETLSEAKAKDALDKQNKNINELKSRIGEYEQQTRKIPGWDNALNAFLEKRDLVSLHEVSKLIDSEAQDLNTSDTAHAHLDFASNALQRIEDAMIIGTENELADSLNSSVEISRYAEFNDENTLSFIEVLEFDQAITSPLTHGRQWDTYLGRFAL